MVGGLFNDECYTVVFIALGDWRENNGMFTVQNWSKRTEESPHNCKSSEKDPLSYIELRSGEDVSVDGADTLFFSGKAGGLALMLKLQFQ